MCDRVSCLSPFAVSGLVGSVDARALGCSQVPTVYATFDPSGESETPPTFLSSMMSMEACSAPLAVRPRQRERGRTPFRASVRRPYVVCVGTEACTVGARLP
jgi:hypothetical protein